MNLKCIHTFLRDYLGWEPYSKRRFIYRFPALDSSGDEFEPDTPEQGWYTKGKTRRRRADLRKRRSH